MTSLTSSQVSTVIKDPASVDAAIESRFSARAFLPRPVEREVLADLLADVQLFPQTMINVRLPSLSGWQDNAVLRAETQAVEAELAGQGRVLIRASGTEPVLRVMVECGEAGRARALAERLAAAAQA